jgi:hypothetical protein
MSLAIIPSKRLNKKTGKPQSYRMPEGPGHYLAREAVWGQISLILFLCDLSMKWTIIGKYKKFGLGDLGNEDGSPVHSHQGHDGGLAVDIFPVHKQSGVRRKGDSNVIHWNSEGYDHAAMKELARLIVQQFKTGYQPASYGAAGTRIYFNDEEVNAAANSAAGYKLFRTDSERLGRKVEHPDKGRQHDEHIHIRIGDVHPYSEQRVQQFLSGAWIL